MEDGRTEVVNQSDMSSIPLKRIFHIVLNITLVFGLVTLATLFCLEKYQAKNQQHFLQLKNQHEKQMKWPGSIGCSFLVSFIRSHNFDNNENRTIFVSSWDDFNMTVTLSEKLRSNLISISNERNGKATLKKINVHHSMVPTISSIEDMAILINTSSVSTVLSMSDLRFNSDSTTVFPVDKLSTSYIISTLSPPIVRKNYFTVASITDNTNINVSLIIDNKTKVSYNGKKYGNGDKITIILSRYQTFQIELSSDLSGTHINATYPVAVFAGNRCNLDVDYGECSMFMDMVPPIDKLDNIFIVPPNLHAYKSLVRIISPTEMQITYSIEGYKTSAILSRNEKIEFTIHGNKTATIESTGYLLVHNFAYASTQTDKYGDPYMIIIPGIHQYLNEYNLIVPEHFNFSFATFILKTDSLVYLRINEKRVHNDKTKFFSTISVDKSFYSVWTLSIPSGVMKVRTTDGTPFGVIIYGESDNGGHAYTGNAIYSTCEEGWFHLESSCYFISLKRATFEYALKACSDEGASLAEHQNVKIEESNEGDVGIWIAVTDIYQEGLYVYASDGSRVKNDNWAKGQPYGGQHYNCAVARKDDNWRWYAFPCRHTFYYVCTKPL